MGECPSCGDKGIKTEYCESCKERHCKNCRGLDCYD